MKQLIFFIMSIFLTLPTIAREISISDTGIYTILDKNLKSIDRYYRLSYRNGKWIMEGKEPNKNWKNVSCEESCQYRKSNLLETQSYFPNTMFHHYDIACIQNIAHAFCRYTLKNQPHQGAYVSVALVTEQPILIFLKRVSL